ncbi:MAG: hypothetical protein JOZ13_09015 [Alphaproteobacteria bacterium]|nr:hypothetical protein [Alphaproteobacteria bacterium]
MVSVGFPTAYSQAAAELALENLALRLLTVAGELKDTARTGEARNPQAAKVIAARLERVALDIRISSENREIGVA